METSVNSEISFKIGDNDLHVMHVLISNLMSWYVFKSTNEQSNIYVLVRLLARMEIINGRNFINDQSCMQITFSCKFAMNLVVDTQLVNNFLSPDAHFLLPYIAIKLLSFWQSPTFFSPTISRFSLLHLTPSSPLLLCMTTLSSPCQMRPIFLIIVFVCWKFFYIEQDKYWNFRNFVDKNLCPLFFFNPFYHSLFHDQYPSSKYTALVCSFNVLLFQPFEKTYQIFKQIFQTSHWMEYHR